MAGWKQRWQTLTSFSICGVVVVLATLLYPLVLLVFSGIALLFPLYRRIFPRPSEGNPTVSGEEARD